MIWNRKYTLPKYNFKKATFIKDTISYQRTGTNDKNMFPSEIRDVNEFDVWRAVIGGAVDERRESERGRGLRLTNESRYDETSSRTRTAQLAQVLCHSYRHRAAHRPFLNSQAIVLILKHTPNRSRLNIETMSIILFLFSSLKNQSRRIYEVL